MIKVIESILKSSIVIDSLHFKKVHNSKIFASRVFRHFLKILHINDPDKLFCKISFRAIFHLNFSNCCSKHFVQILHIVDLDKLYCKLSFCTIFQLGFCKLLFQTFCRNFAHCCSRQLFLEIENLSSVYSTFSPSPKNLDTYKVSFTIRHQSRYE